MKLKTCLLVVTRPARGQAFSAAGAPGGGLSPATPAHREILLGEKLRGFGAGRVVPPGGKIDSDETPRDAAVRELAEETSLLTEVSDLVELATLDFTFEADAGPAMLARVYGVTEFNGVATDSDELALRWVATDALPLEQMWPDARQWLPVAMSGQSARWRFRYSADQTLLASERMS